MTEKEPENLLNQCEGEAAECKPKLLRRHEIGESAVGIGNAGGGYLSMGVRGRIPRKILPVQIPSQDDLARIRESVADSAKIRLRFSPAVSFPSASLCGNQEGGTGKVFLPSAPGFLPGQPGDGPERPT